MADQDTSQPTPPAPTPPVRDAEFSTSDTRIRWMLLGFGLLFACNGWERDFWSPEEPDFAAACREMGEDGNWLVPTHVGRPYVEKPPLLYWAALVFEKVFFLDPHLAYRLPSVLAAVLGLWVTFVLGAALFDRRLASGAVLIQGTSFLFFHVGSRFLTDMLFSSAVALSITSFWMATELEVKRRRWKWLAFVGLAVACLSKSPFLGPYLIVMPIAVFSLLSGGLKEIVRTFVKFRPLRGLIGCLLVVLPWYLWMAFTGGSEFLGDAIGEHHLGRLWDADSHRQPAWYYLVTILVDFLPWTLFLPLGLFFGHAHFRQSGPGRLVVWVLITIVTLTLISSKQGKYLLPMWTPLCLLVSAGLLGDHRESIWESFLGVRLLAFFPWFLTGLAAVLSVTPLLWLAGAVPASLRREPFQDFIEDRGVQLGALCLMGIAAAALGFGAVKMRTALKARDRLKALHWASAALAVTYLAFSFSYSTLNSVKSARRFCERAGAWTASGEVAIYGTARPAILYYYPKRIDLVLGRPDPTGTDLTNEKALETYLRAAEERYLIIYEKDLHKLEGNFPRFQNYYREIGSGYVGSRRRYIVLRNKPAG